MAGLVLGVGLAVAGGYTLLLYAFNPVADEWQCSEGEAPADHRSGGAACFAEGSELPKGYRWDPLGNRPMGYNCDKRGWVEIEQVRSSPATPTAWPRAPRCPSGWRAVPD